MVTLTQVQATNSRVATALPPNLVAVFAGATTGIGNTALLTFAKYTLKPRIYFIGRSEEQGAKLTVQMQEANPDGEYIFLQKDLSLLVNVDEVCKEIAKREKTINVLLMSQGTLKRGETPEGLPYMSAVSIHSRLRMATNLLPLIRRAPALRRVISVFAGTKEGKLYIDDLRGRNVPLLDTRGHSAALMTLSLEALARKAPEVSFVHNFPGSVDTDLVRAETGFILLVLWQMFKLVRWTAFMPFEECGERHAYLCVSGMYPSKGGEEGVSLEKGLSVAKGADGKPASGVYSIDGEGESAPESVVSTLQKYRSDGYVGKVWEYIEGEFKRITGSAAVEL